MPLRDRRTLAHRPPNRPLARALSGFRVRTAGVAVASSNLSPTGNSDRASGAARVLVVDDDAQVASLLRELLSTMGYAVKASLSGEDALDEVLTFEPDVVLLDLTLPGITGGEVLDALRQTHPRIPVIAMTGDPQRATGIVARGAVAYLAKPFSVQTVRQAIRAALGEPEK